MTDETKGWPPVLLVSDDADHITQVTSGLIAGGVTDITPVSMSDVVSAYRNGDYGLTIIDITMDVEGALALIPDLLDNETALLGLVSKIDQNVVRAIKAGVDSVAIYPADVNRIGLPAILAFDRARARLNLSVAHEQILEQTRLSNAKIRSIVHDLKNPLTVIMGNLQVLQSTTRETLSANAVKMVTNALRGCRMQLSMMSNLSDLVKFEEGRFHVRLETVNLAEIAEKTLNEFAATDVRKEYSFKNINSSLIKADQSVLKRVLQNLLAHSSHYTRDGDHISLTIDYAPKEHLVKLMLIDDGEAIPAELGDLIFESSVKALDNSRFTRWDRGMMLAHTRKAIRHIGGDAVLDGQPRKGARIMVTIPAVERENSSSSR